MVANWIGRDELKNVNILYVNILYIWSKPKKNIMTHDEAILQENFDKLKANGLVLEQNLEHSKNYDVAIKHISGQVFKAGIVYYKDVPEWLNENIEEAICLSKQYLKAHTGKLNGSFIPKGMILEECTPYVFLDEMVNYKKNHSFTPKEIAAFDDALEAGKKYAHKIKFQNGSIIKSEFIETGNEGRGNSPIPEQDMPHENSIYTLHMLTGFPENEIMDFLKLSGLKFLKAKEVLKRYESCSMELRTINRLLILGELKYE